MLAPGMIRKMGKTYSDKRMTKDCRIHYQADAWSNGFIAFKEPLPKHLAGVEHECICHDFWPEMEEEHTRESQQVWPVEIRPVHDDGKRLVRLSDGNGLAVWLDAGYLSAILKREPTATLYVAHRKGAAVVAKNGKAFAMVMPVTWDTDEKKAQELEKSEWNITNTDLADAREFDTANELAALLPDRPGSKWHKIFYMGMMLEARRSGRNNKERTLHVRMVGRDATSHISLYDGRGVYRD